METSKRQKTQDTRYHELASLGRASFVSKSGIAKLLSEVKVNGLPDAFSRSSQYRARKHVCNTTTEYGKLVVELDVMKADGKLMKMGFQNPLAFMAYQCEHSVHFAEIVRRAMERTLLYLDATPHIHFQIQTLNATKDARRQRRYLIKTMHARRGTTRRDETDPTKQDKPLHD